MKKQTLQLNRGDKVRLKNGEMTHITWLGGKETMPCHLSEGLTHVDKHYYGVVSGEIVMWDDEGCRIVKHQPSGLASTTQQDAYAIEGVIQ